jgi:hypothetical protein
MLLKFSRIGIQPRLKNDIKAKASDFIVSELLADKKSLERFKFTWVVSDKLALELPIYKILKLAVKQLTPVIENRKKGGHARWKRG